MGRAADHPGDGFFFEVEMFPDLDAKFNWIEVTEVFTIVPASEVEGAMKDLHGIHAKNSIDFNEFRKELKMGRPSRVEQRKAADKVICQIEKKLAKVSYQELLDKYGYGTLVVGLPLWFAVFPEDPLRIENALDDFFTRISRELEELKKKQLERRDCPYSRVKIVWDTSPEAWNEWNQVKSAEYSNPINVGLNNPIFTPVFCPLLSKIAHESCRRLQIDESEESSLHLSLEASVSKRKQSKGSLPVLVAAFQEQILLGNFPKLGFSGRFRLILASFLCKFYCFVRIYGWVGFRKWTFGRMSASRAMKLKIVYWKSRHYYRESRRRSKLRETADKSLN